MAWVDEDRDGNGLVDTGHDEAAFETDQLELESDGEDRLPWLEGDDDDYDDEGSGAGKVIGLMLGGVALLGAIVGGIWWATHGEPDPALVADGSTIAAPDAPYKEAPKDPGGKTFDGTGDSSFAVSEGQSRPVRLGQEDAAPKPGFSEPPKAAPAPQAAAPAAPAPRATPAPVADTSGVGVQVGAFSTRASAEAAWGRLSQQHSALSGLRHRVVEGRADIGTVFRLQAVAADASAASALCGRLKASGLGCQVKN